MKRRRVLAVFIATVTAAAMMMTPAAGQEPDVRCDVNGDGYADVAIGAPREGIAGARQAGAVHVFYGHPDGRLRPTGDDLWHQGDRGIAGAPEVGDLLGSAVACADFDGDGFADVAAGAHGEGIAGKRSGAVQVFYGSRNGISRRDQIWHQDKRGVKGLAAEDDQFAKAVAAGYLDNDQYADLIVGVPGADVSGEDGAGAVQVLYGSADGVSARDDLWHQDERGIVATAGDRDFFGSAVGTGDFNGDGFDDLAVGVPGETIRGEGRAGAVHVLYSSAGGVTRTDELWHQASRGIKGGAEARDFFGNGVGAADFDADGFDDLIVGIPGEGIAGKDRAGAVQVIYGSSNGLTARDDLWHQDARGIAANAGANDQFGHSVDAGDFDGDGFADLATGVIGEVLRGNDQAGAIHVLYGSSNGVTRRDQLWHQNDRGVDGAAERGDLFGFAVFAADFDGDGSDDLAVGVQGEGLGGRNRAGAVQTLYGGEDFLTARGTMWHQASRGVAGAIERGDNVGWALP